jgi:hypothetical protein
MVAGRKDSTIGGETLHVSNYIIIIKFAKIFCYETRSLLSTNNSFIVYIKPVYPSSQLQVNLFLENILLTKLLVFPKHQFYCTVSIPSCDPTRKHFV